MDNDQNVKTRDEWDSFVKSHVINFMTEHNLQKIQVDDGCGKKGKITINSKGEYKVDISAVEML